MERKFVDTLVSMDLLPPNVMKLDSQGPLVSYTDMATKPAKEEEQPKRMSVCLCDIWVRDEQRNKEKAATQATLAHITQLEWDEEAHPKERRGVALQESLSNVEPSSSWPRKGLSCRKEYNQ